MTENEIIIVDGIPNKEYNVFVKESVKYAIISLPFTVNRMDISGINTRIQNTAKGKIAESAFKIFCKANNIDSNFDICSTPFWTVDKRDFTLLGLEWDIKNNYIYHSGSTLQGYHYSHLPGLVPNKHNGDQWSKKNEQFINNTKSTAYLFTFMKGADLTNNSRGDYFLKINISTHQFDFIKSLWDKYQGQPQSEEPFSEEWFWNEMSNKGSESFFELKFNPNLIISGCANPNYWHLFKDTGAYEKNNFLQDYFEDYTWYKKARTGSLNFMNGTFWSRITNATIPVTALPSFLSLFPSLKNTIKYGRIKF